MKTPRINPLKGPDEFPGVTRVYLDAAATPAASRETGHGDPVLGSGATVPFIRADEVPGRGRGLSVVHDGPAAGISPTTVTTSGDRDGPLPRFLLVITVGTGLLDAVSFLQLGHVFVANMTGNVVFLGFAVAGASDVSVSTSLLALAAFLAGALLGGRVGIRYGTHRGRLLEIASAMEVVLVAAALILATVESEIVLDHLKRHIVVVLLAVAMGVQNAAARRVGVPDLTTTVLTLTLTGLAAESRWAGGTNPRWKRRVAAVVAMLVGAMVGGYLVLYVGMTAALGAATALLMANGIVIHRLASPSAPWASPR